MNTPNFINIIKMPNIMVDFKRFLQLLSPENPLCQINSMINEFNKSNLKGDNITKNFGKLNDIKKRKNNQSLLKIIFIMDKH